MPPCWYLKVPISSKALLNAALTSGTLSLLGDVLAQLLKQRRKVGGSCIPQIWQAWLR